MMGLFEASVENNIELLVMSRVLKLIILTKKERKEYFAVKQVIYS